MIDSHDNKGTALVTGAADRLGAAFVLALADAGYGVIIHYNNAREKAERFAKDLVANGKQATALHADLTDRASRARLIPAATEQFGPLTVLINNASIYEKDSPATLDEQVWDRHFALHAEAPAFLSRDFAAQLPQGTKGDIINIIDERVLHPAPAAFSYNLSKATLWLATQTLAQNLAPNIRVNAIGPGPILPEAGQSIEDFEARNAYALTGQTARPGDAVKTMLFLLEAPAITGQMIAVDGGEHLSWPAQRGPTPADT